MTVSEAQSAAWRRESAIHAAPLVRGLADDAGAPFPALPVGDLWLALAENRIHTLYQPIVRLADRRPAGLEVLARLDHPRLGTLSPASFVPSMERAGLAGALTEAVLVAALADWPAERLAELELTLAFNFPPEILTSDAAVARLETVRVAAGLAANQIVIELTENDPFADPVALSRAVRRLRALGYGIAADDVGRDAADDAALFDIGFTALKLDKTLVQDAPTDPAAAALICRLSRDARAAGMSVTAEGIENEEQWAAVQALAVDLAQGYLISLPLSAAVARRWHRSW